ncbi:MAG TPA: hypothetical protein VIN93_04590 [Bryobacteraceae bacterium]
MTRKETLSAIADSAGEIADLHQRLGKALKKHVSHLKALVSSDEAGGKVDAVAEFFKTYQQPGAVTKIADADELFR